MNRLLWGIALFVVATAGWAQSTWRGQAEVWPVGSAPVDGFVAASNEFPRNSLLTVENYRSKKTIQVRIVSSLPNGSSALVLLNAKAAQALDIKAGDSPLVGVRLDPTGVDRADNPDPDVNPLAAKPVVATAPVPVPAPVAAPLPPLVAPAPPSSLDVVKATTTPDPTLVPLPTLAAPEPVTEPAAVPLAVADENEAPTPVTPGKKVFVTTRDPEPVAAETPEVVTPPTVAPAVAASEAPAEAGVAPTPVEATTPVAAMPPAPEAAPEVVEAPAASVPPEVAPSSPNVPLAAVPAAPEPALAPTAVPLPPSNAWVSAPAKLEGPVLGQVALLASLEKGRNYVQVGAYATEAKVLAALASVKSYVPLALYRAEGEKNPWRVIVPSAPKSQLGLLLMSFRAQGYRTAGVVKG